MGWVALALIGIAAAGLLRLTGVGRDMMWFVGAALMLGATGYALQGNPGVQEHPVVPDVTPIEVDPGLVALRGKMFGQFTGEGAFLGTSDALIRSGDLRTGTSLILSGIRQSPNSVMLWTGLGTALAQHDGDTMSPAAMFAFRRAITLAPDHPGPYFFLGVAYIRAQQLPAARAAWSRALALTPTTVSYRNELAGRLKLLDQFLAENAGAPAQ
jgi:tetratricopeptide (TPR) repeat protein